ncbi:MAG: GNAT family N-acetyltransferase [Leucobacter sp.]
MIQNITRARTVLPPSGWTACGVQGRQLEPADLDDLIALGRDDVTFAWERERKSGDYYSGLLQFRLGHYWRYSFGVHGIWQGSSMVGQVGLQVLSEDNDQIEFVVFLSQLYKGHGLGTCLARYLMERCRSVGMTELFGVVRVDNPEGLALMANLEAQALDRILHFGQEAQVFRISLKNGGTCQPAS